MRRPKITDTDMAWRDLQGRAGQGRAVRVQCLSKKVGGWKMVEQGPLPWPPYQLIRTVLYCTVLYCSMAERTSVNRYQLDCQWDRPAPHRTGP